MNRAATTVRAIVLLGLICSCDSELDSRPRPGEPDAGCLVEAGCAAAGVEAGVLWEAGTLAPDAVGTDVGSTGPDGGPPPADAGQPDSGPGVALTAAQQPYDPVKFAFNQKIPVGVGDDPRSTAVADRLDTLTADKKVAMSVEGEVPPVYVVSPSDPLYSVTVDGQETSFRVPAGAVPGGGADYPLILLDPLHPDHGAFTELRLWQASVNAGSKTLTASGAGLFHYNNDGQLLNPDATPSISVPFLGWGTGSGLSYLAGLIRPDEVKQGVIAHALRFNYSACHSSDTFRAPATKTDQPNGCSTQDPPSAMEMGMRLQLSPSVDCSARTVPGKADGSKETRFVRMICRALQDYGMIMTDGTGPGGLLLMMEHKATADWQATVGDELWGSYGYLVRDQDTPDDGQQRGPSDGIPWGQLRVLAKSVF